MIIIYILSKTERNEEIFIMFYIELQKMSIGRKINKKNTSFKIINILGEIKRGA